MIPACPTFRPHLASKVVFNPSVIAYLKQFSTRLLILTNVLLCCACLVNQLVAHARNLAETRSTDMFHHNAIKIINFYVFLLFII